MPVFQVQIELESGELKLYIGDHEITKGYGACDCNYLYLPDDPISYIVGIGANNWDSDLNTWKEKFIDAYNQNKPIILMGTHPKDCNETVLSDWAEFTEWVYMNYDLINMNYTDAYNYKHDLESIILDKQNDAIYSLNFQDVFNPLEITWSEPGDWIVEYAHNHTRYGDLNVSSSSDNIILEPGYDYIIRLASAPINTNDDSNEDQNDPIPFKNIALFLLIIVIVIYSLFKSVNKRR